MVVARVPIPRRVLMPAAGAAAAVVTVGAVAVGAVAVGAAHAGRPAGFAGDPAAGRSAVAASTVADDRPVARLRHLTAPDAIAVLSRPATSRQLHRLWHVSGVRALTVTDVGHITVRGHRLAALGVNPGTARGFTPSLTAQSDPLWQSVAGGDVTIGYAAAHALRHRLGQSVTVYGSRGHSATLRIGAFASIGLGPAEAVVSRPAAERLGFRPSRRIFVSAPKLDVGTIAVDVRRIFGRGVVVRDVRPHVVQQPLSAYAQATIPPAYLALYRSAAATCPGLPWTVLAGIGAVETGHGANVHRSIKGAEGPMQFLPSTFAAYGVDGNGDGVADINNPADAIYSAARYLCLWGASRGGQSLYDAIWAYNHADWYVRLVIEYANAYV